MQIYIQFNLGSLFHINNMNPFPAMDVFDNFRGASGSKEVCARLGPRWSLGGALTAPRLAWLGLGLVLMQLQQLRPSQV